MAAGDPSAPIVAEYEREARVPYAIEIRPDARHLIVSFPALTAGRAAPLVEIGRYLGDVPCHRLYIGADEHFYIGPEGRLAGATTAIHLIWREARRLGIPEHNVICIGSSFRGSCALYAGLKTRSGLILAGAPPVRMGNWIYKMLHGAAPSGKAVRMRQALAEITGVDERPESRVHLDRLILRASQRATHKAHIELYASPRDQLLKESQWLHDELRDHPTIQCSLEIDDYGAHTHIKEAYFKFVRRRIRRAITSR
jgi:hypothetical protein